MTDSATWPVRQSSRLVILNARNELLMVRHRDSQRTYWILPGGGVDEGETWEAAAVREMWEETGITGWNGWLPGERAMNRRPAAQQRESAE